MAKATDATKQLDAKLEALSTRFDTELGALKEVTTRIAKQLDAIAATQTEIVAKVNEIHSRPASGGAKTGGKKPPAAAAMKLVDTEGNAVTSTEWFKYQWCNNHAEFKKQYMTARHEKAVDEYMKAEKPALTGEKATQERMKYFWSHFVLKESDHVDNELRAKITKGYNEFKAKVEAEKKSPAAAAKPAATKANKAPATPATTATPKNKKGAATKKPEPVVEEAPAEEETPAEEEPAEDGDAVADEDAAAEEEAPADD